MKAAFDQLKEANLDICKHINFIDITATGRNAEADLENRHRALYFLAQPHPALAKKIANHCFGLYKHCFFIMNLCTQRI